MNAQTAIDVMGKVLPLVLDVASLIPGVNIPVGAVKVVEDVITIEQSAHAWLTKTPEGQKVLFRIESLGADLGAAMTVSPEGQVTFTVAQAIDALEKGEA